MESRLVGRTALITGAGSGIGAACARRLAAEGAKVAVVDLDGRTAESVAKEITESGREAIPLVADVTENAQVEAAFEETMRKFGRLDILLANAGITSYLAPIGECPEESWRRVLDVNLTGVFLCVKAALRPMRRQKSGVILATASMAGLMPLPAGIEYSVAKTGVIMLIRHVAQIYGPDGIRAVAVCPGWVDSPFLKPIWEAYGGWTGRAALKASAPLGRLATPEDIAASVAFLASDEASFISGAAFTIDGGASAGLPVRQGALARGYLYLRAGGRRLLGKSTPLPF